MVTKQKVIWADTAEKDYLDTLDFWYEHNQSLEYPEKIIKEVEKITEMLPNTPYMGVWVKENLRKIVLLKNFIIFYEVSESRIEIVHFFDGRDNPEKILDKIN